MRLCMTVCVCDHDNEMMLLVVVWKCYFVLMVIAVFWFVLFDVTCYFV